MPTTPNIGIPGGPPVPFDEMTLTGALIAFVLLVVSVLILWLLRSRNGNGGAGARPTRPGDAAIRIARHRPDRAA